MFRLLRFIKCLLLISVCGSSVIFAQESSNESVALAESGLKVVKSRWYRHVVMLSVPPFSASNGSGLPSGTSVGNRRGFIYEATIKNESGREIKAVHWDHVFLDPKNGKEMRRFHFYNDRNSIGKGKTTTLQRLSGHPPSGTIDASALEKGSPQYKERIDIKCVLFKGDIIWQAVTAMSGECAAMRRKLRSSSK